MGSKPQVTLTFGGDSAKLEQAFDNVGTAANKMEGKVDDAGKGFDRVGEAADAVDTKAMGFRDTMTGVQDTMGGVSKIAKGDLFDGFLTLGMGVGDLGSGLFNFLVPSLKSAVGWLGQTRVGQLAAAGAMKVATAAQWLWNIAMSANPIMIVVLAVIALVAIIVIIATKTDWFQKLWHAIWGKIGDPVKAIWNWIRVNWSKLPEFITRPVGAAVDWVVRSFNRVKGVVFGVRDAISGAFRSAFNFVASAWNNTIGRLSWTVPRWVPFIGGNTVSAPQIPYFHSGGVMPGAPGTEGLAILQAGERVTPAGGRDRLVLEVHSGGSRLDDLLVEIIAGAVRDRGGDVGLVLGGRRG
jgi:hypothetical protein